MIDQGRIRAMIGPGRIRFLGFHFRLLLTRDDHLDQIEIDVWFDPVQSRLDQDRRKMKLNYFRPDFLHRPRSHFEMDVEI